MSTGKIVGAVASLAILGVMGYMAMNDSGESQSNDVNTTQQSQNQNTQPPTNKDALSEEEQKIKELKDETREFKVSDLYIAKCSPCHGDNGQGVIGPKLYGKSEQEITKKLHDYKEGKVKNSMMAGLLTNTTDDDLKSLANEISNFGK